MQGQVQYNLKFSFSIDYSNDTCGHYPNETDDGEFVYVIIYNEADIEINTLEVEYYDVKENNNVDSFSSEIITLSERPYRIEINYINDVGGVSGFDFCNSGYSDVFYNDLLFNHGNFHDYDSKTINHPNGVRTFIDATISPIIETPNDSNICPNEIIYSDIEDSEFINGLTWYFFNDNNNWEQLENYSNYYPLKYSVEDIIGNDYLSRTGSNAIKLKYKYQYNSSSEILESDIVIINIETCSPKILSFTPTDTQCSYSSDGGFTTTFDRALNAGEELIMTLWKIEGVSQILIDQTDPGEVTSLGAGNTYNWPISQASGNYLVKYQTKTGSTFSSLETSRQFTIDNPLPITFSATKLNDVYCNGGSDGVIQLNASGGVGGFKYELNNTNIWLPFSAANTHSITGLPKGTKKIKVQDANGCTEKE
ncbi:SprB repeat-containing protein [uncultured Polaribacter sp.]|uniref:SprB repeat-containing protein n=1 Tax=uncultured Polaribacter sp. TaxID=174711 RepID=UPI00260413D6|nr:SprB repeat-containing protein [uncultured Polaribacter sp.]